MRLVIGDSDNEDGAEPVAELVRGLGSSKGGELTGRNNPESSAFQSTSSSEKLRREMGHVHRAMIEPALSGKRRATDDLAVLITTSPKHSKLRRAKTISTTVQVPDNEQRKLKRRKVMEDISAATNSQVLQSCTEQVLNDWQVPSSNPIANPGVHGGGNKHSSTRSITSRTGDDETKCQQVTTHGASITISCELSGIQHGERPSAHNQSSALPYNAGDIVTTQHSSFSATERENAPLVHNGSISTAEQRSPVGIEVSPARTFSAVYKTTRNQSDLQRNAMTTSTPPKRRKIVEDDSADELDAITKSDEIAIGIPKERYKPRPSRSRSVQVPAQELFSSANQPVQKVGSKPRRCKTIGATVENDSALLREMGFRSSQADRALREADGNMSRAVELLTSGNSAFQADQLENVHRTSSTTEAPRSPAVDEVPTPPRAYSTKIDMDLSEVDKEAPLQDGKHLACLVKRRKAVIHALSDMDTHFEGACIEESDMVVRNTAPHPADGENDSKKKGRGRPKKVRKPSNEEVAIGMTNIPHACLDEMAIPTTHKQDTPHENRVKEMVPIIDSTSTNAANEHLNPNLTPTEKPPQTPSTSPSKSYSPINKGQVPLKVGLSKRTQIPSLLRSIKK